MQNYFKWISIYIMSTPFLNEKSIPVYFRKKYNIKSFQFRDLKLIYFLCDTNLKLAWKN